MAASRAETGHLSAEPRGIHFGIDKSGGGGRRSVLLRRRLETGSKTDYRFAAQALASEGFLTVMPDYRLYPQVMFPAFVDDGALASAGSTTTPHNSAGTPRTCS